MSQWTTRHASPERGHLVYGAVDPATTQALVQSGLRAVSTTGPAGELIARSGGAAVSAATAAPVVTSLLSAAGVTSVAAPPWSLVVAGGLAAAAGTIALVAGIRSGKLTKSEAVALAYQMGIPDAGQVPGFTAKVMRASASKRLKLASRVDAQLRRKGSWWAPASWFRSQARLEAKARIIGAVIALDQAQARGAAPPAIPASQAGTQYGGTPTSPLLLLGLGLFGLAILMAVMPSGSTRRAVPPPPPAPE